MKVTDLRSALELLRTMPGELVETDVEVDPAAELSGVYRYVGAGGTVQRPTKVDGPTMLFHNIKGHPDATVAIGVVGSRKRVAITIPGVRCHPLDPSAGPEYDPSILDRGISCKTIFDCTVPFHLKDKFKRAQFMEVDPKHWLPDFEG